MRIIVVGGGIIGLACAWRLARRGAQVALFESRRIGVGASGAALGALWPPSALNKGPLQRLHRRSLWGFDSFVGEVAGASGLAVDFSRKGRIELLNSANAVAKAKEEIAAANEEWPALVEGKRAQEFLSAEEVRQILTGCVEPMHGALRCHNTAQVHVESLLAALTAACLRAGVTVNEDMAATLRSPGVVETSLGMHKADAVLVTAGAWTEAIIPGARVTPVKGQALRAARPKSVQLQGIVKSGSTYLVPWENEILVGATTEPEAMFDETATEAAREKLCAAAAKIVPELASAEVLRHWTGLRPDAPHHQPLMGPLSGMARTYVCAGHYKSGIGLAPLVSELMADLILDGAVPEELRPFLP